MKIVNIIKRTGELKPFDASRIHHAIEKAFLSVNLIDIESVLKVTDKVVLEVESRSNSEITTIETIQDIVEETLMTYGFLKVAKSFILYREERHQERQKKLLEQIKDKKIEIKVSPAETIIFNPNTIEEGLRQLTPDLLKISITEMVETVTKQIYNKIPQKEIDLLILGAARERIEKHYEYAYLSSRIVLNYLYVDILNDHFNSPSIEGSYQEKFKDYVQRGVDLDLLNPEMLSFNLDLLAKALDPNRDKLFMYLGTQILMDRYLLCDRSHQKKIFELPQWFWMRVAMGLALKEKEKEKWAIAFYHVLSKMDLVSSTPTLFNSGTLHSQMSSCYLNLAHDSLDSIFKLFSDNAKLSKWAGGIGSDWTYVRATGSKIKGTNGLSQGVIPFIKIFNDVALAVNQGGKRKGAMCAYMEVWHLDFEQFLELKKNTGDERRRAHDINTAAWIPDLFMKRVLQNGHWTLFCPNDVPDLHDLYGQAFEARYVHYEHQNLTRAKTIKAVDLWRKMLTMLYETGHPWITFKDAANVRNPQSHAGVIHSSNLCTEITLNTSEKETAVCNLASLNLANMIKDGQLNEEKIKSTIQIGIRMLDNVIDNNYYPTPEAEYANLQHRAVGLGLMGYQDALYQLNIAFDSKENLLFSDLSMEMVSYYAILSSSELATERGSYPSFKGSKWDQGIMPHDTLALLEKERGQSIQVDRTTRMDWNYLRRHISMHGMRNSNTMAIAPTATISNISGVFPCTEPAYKNIYMKENLSGNFLIINRYLVDDLEKIGLWTDSILQKIKLYDGCITQVVDIPEIIRTKYKETFEIDMTWLIEATALRSKWIDQSASTNIFMKTKSGKDLSDVYILAWEKGLKTTYYLRTLGASQVAKATIGELETQLPSNTVPTECEACQ